MRQIRILTGVAAETMQGFKQSGWSNWLIVSILAIALTIFGGILQLTMTLKNVVSAWGSQLSISAYLKDGYDPHVIANKISLLPNVKLVEVVPKDVAWQEMQTKFKVAAFNNPLPNTLHIQLNSSEVVERTASQIKEAEGVEHVRYPLAVARNLNQFRHFLEAAGIIVTAALTAATLMVIANTIQLVIQSREREIEIQSLMGVGPWYIKGPLVLQGAAYGLVSAILAVIIIWSVDVYMETCLTKQFVGLLPLLPKSFSYGIMPTFIILLILGIIVGASGSAWTSRRYIKI